MCTLHCKPFLVKPQRFLPLTAKTQKKFYWFKEIQTLQHKHALLWVTKQLWLRYSLTFWNNWCSCGSRWNILIIRDCIFYFHIFISLGFSESKSLHFSFWIIGITTMAIWRWEVSCHCNLEGQPPPPHTFKNNFKIIFFILNLSVLNPATLTAYIL